MLMMMMVMMMMMMMMIIIMMMTVTDVLQPLSVAPSTVMQCVFVRAFY